MKKSVAWIFEQVTPARPNYRVPFPDQAELLRLAETSGNYDRIIQGAICDALEAAGETASLLRHEQPSERQITAHDMRAAISHALRYGICSPSATMRQIG